MYKRQGYYHVRAPENCTGYVYRNRVRLRNAELPAWARSIPTGGGGTTHSAGDGRIGVCSFNIKWLGHYTRKDHQELARMLSAYDLVVVQELIAPPRDVTTATGTIPADPQGAEFFQLMAEYGFRDALSERGTGKSEPASGVTAHEWPVVFYRDDELVYDPVHSGFVSSPVAANPDFDRVPRAFHFTTRDGTLDFTVINAHLKASANQAAGRKIELAKIAQWCNADAASTGEQDHLIVGDLNIQSSGELANALPAGFVSLNSTPLFTNLIGTAPYDHVLYRTNTTTSDIDLDAGFTVLDLKERMRTTWRFSIPYPDDQNSLFEQYYSDHEPVVFQLKYGNSDDD